MSIAETNERVLDLLEKNEHGLSVREIADVLEIDHMKAQNAVNRLYMADKVGVVFPQKIDENKRFAIDDS